MFASKTLRQAAAHAERQPMIRFIGPRTIPSKIDHSPQVHPASPTGTLPKGFEQAQAKASSASGGSSSRHTSFSSYRDHAQQFGPLQKTILPAAEKGIGGTPGSELGEVAPPKGQFFDRTELPTRFFRKVPLDIAEIEAIESGGAALFK